jgi:NADH-quinone oxidoreductase subunit J
LELQVLLFTAFAIGAVATAMLTITRKNPVSSAMNLVGHFFMLSGLYLTLQAQFVAAVQVLVYAGAIMVLVVFVIMLLNLGREQQAAESGSGMRKVIGTVFAALFAGLMILTVVGKPTGRNALSPEAATMGTTESIGQSLFTEYLFPFEAVSLLLLAALIGAVVIAKRHIKESA